MVPSFRSTRRRRLLAMLASAVMPIPAANALAQAAYPDRPVKIVVGFAPGGTNDILARLVAAELQDRLKQGVIVENKPGANSAIGNDLVAKAKADGYTLLVSSSGGMTTNPVLMRTCRTTR
jgi:tripartite-type tricarboxylate transporter receptor subunit TctC